MVTNIDRINSFLDNLIIHPKFKQCLESTLNCVNAVTTGPYGICIFCQPGTGKTKLGDYLTLQLNKSCIQTRECKQIKAIKIDLEEGALATDVKRSIIYQITGDYPSGYTKQVLNNYLKQQLKVANVKIIIIDEFHHLLRGEKRIDQKVGQFIKSLIDKYNVAVLLLGIPRAQKILELDTELNSRVIQGGMLELFNCKNDNSRAYFQKFLREYSAKCPVPIIDLSTDNMAYRMELATGGDLRRIRQLFQHMLLHIDEGEEITIAHLDVAHRQLNKANGNYDSNNQVIWPFSSEVTLQQVKQALVYE
ncbi:ATP-binding protein [Pseudoalteromonas sp. SSDWG2]|uniref:ATP-binding protein n=1 Tax=Pseudoalteromonas sp. SSDWG2 TaxID=3139391 RepID=UPI003BAAFD8C